MALLLTGWPEAPARADEADATVFGWQAQATAVDQYHPPFTSPYRGPHSLDPGHRGNETFDATLFAGWRLAPWLDAYADPEIDQGYGLSDTLGVAGFPARRPTSWARSGPISACSVPFCAPRSASAARPSRSPPRRTSSPRRVRPERVVVTMGKLAVTDIFDTNDYAQ